MAITLQESKVSMADKVDQMVIDEFRRSSLLLDKLIFDDAVSPGTGGSTLTYGYTRLKTPAQAQFREINKEYTAQEAKREKHTVDLKVFGGAFELD
ncbi:phage capsid protein, partial [Clostridium sporogenes]|nr:phage capsid protein [Clostridium sporogenes]